jgi:hypothetical protein
MLEVQEQRAWHEVVTLDESWFYGGTEYESIWLPPGEKVPEMARVTIQCETVNGQHYLEFQRIPFDARSYK